MKNCRNGIAVTDETVLIKLPKSLYERIAFRMEALDNDQDYWQLYCACLNAPNEPQSADAI